MAPQIHHIVPIIIIVALYSSLCYGRNIHLLHSKEEYNHPSAHSHLEDDRGLRKRIGDGIQTVQRSFRRLIVSKPFNVDDFGAVGDGSADDTKAFEKAWKKACSSHSGAVFLVPSDKSYLVKPVSFSGPCKSEITIQISGTIIASKHRSDYERNLRHWLVFKNINDLSVGGGGLIDGNGKIWWEKSCKVDKEMSCKHAPTALIFDGCKNLLVRNLNIQNSQKMHLSFQRCNFVKVSGLNISAPGDSPNTDGIHITDTQNIDVTSSVIGTGDDCISIENGSRFVRAMDITCGPGHGISIGSLGDKNSEAHVSDIIVDGASIFGTSNGLRIKTWQGGSGLASNIVFQNITLNNVDNPIIIDQNYCDKKKPCKEKASAVQVRNVVYRNIRGTSSSKDAVVFDCSEDHPCEGISMEHIQIVSSEADKTTAATCNNVNISRVEDVSPQCSAT